MLESSRAGLYNSVNGDRYRTPPALPLSTPAVLLTTRYNEISGERVPSRDLLFYLIRPHMLPVIVNNDCTYLGVYLIN